MYIIVLTLWNKFLSKCECIRRKLIQSGHKRMRGLYKTKKNLHQNNQPTSWKVDLLNDKIFATPVSDKGLRARIPKGTCTIKKTKTKNKSNNSNEK